MTLKCDVILTNRISSFNQDLNVRPNTNCCTVFEPQYKQRIITKLTEFKGIIYLNSNSTSDDSKTMDSFDAAMFYKTTAQCRSCFP